MPEKQPITLNDLDLTMKYLTGKMTMYRLTKTKGLKGSSQTYSFVCQVLRHFEDKGQIEVKLIKL